MIDRGVGCGGSIAIFNIISYCRLGLLTLNMTWNGQYINVYFKISEFLLK